jgi:UDP-galactopyranose mutase
MDKLLTIPKEKHIHRMKNGTRYTLPLNLQEIIKLLKDHQWSVDDEDALKDLIELIRAVEKVHGVV